jgi:hypothetical protein
LGRLFCAHYTKPTDDKPGKLMDFAPKRLQLGEGLYYKLLENILLDERKKKPDLDITVLKLASLFHVWYLMLFYILGSWFRVSLIMGFLVLLDNTVYFDVFICTLRVSGIYHPSSGASLQIGL